MASADFREREALVREVADLAGRDVGWQREGGAAPPPPASVSPWPDGSARPPTSVERKRRVLQLAKVIEPGITNSKRDTRFPAGKGLFAGSWDWHSCVHAHWALLAIARVCKDAKIERTLLARLTASNLSSERQWLAEKAQEKFELPYGRAWLLLMLDELDRRKLPTDVNAELAKLRKDNEDRVVEFLKTTTFPEAAPAFVATHDSWLFALLLLLLSRPQRAAVTREIPDLRKRAVAQRAAIAKHKVLDSDFLFLPAVLAMVDRVGVGRPATPAQYALEPSLALQKAPLDDSNAHSAGAAMVRLWPHAVLSHRGVATRRARVAARMAEMYARPDHWRDDFERVAHWVPQFMWMTEWLELGRP